MTDVELDELGENGKRVWLEIRRNCMPQVETLLAAGWRFELPEIVNRTERNPVLMDTEPWQWYWRSPPKRKGSKGRKYLSTQQAYNALMRSCNGTGVVWG
jgi:hypothetical protein